MIFPARCDDRLGYVFRTHLLHRPSQFGHQLEMIKQMALGRQIDAVGGLLWRLYVKGDKRRTVTRGNPVCFSDDAPGRLFIAADAGQNLFPSSASCKILSGTRSFISIPVISFTSPLRLSMCWILIAEITLILRQAAPSRLPISCDGGSLPHWYEPVRQQ